VEGEPLQAAPSLLPGRGRAPRSRRRQRRIPVIVGAGTRLETVFKTVAFVRSTTPPDPTSSQLVSVEGCPSSRVSPPAAGVNPAQTLPSPRHVATGWRSALAHVTAAATARAATSGTVLDHLHPHRLFVRGDGAHAVSEEVHPRRGAAARGSRIPDGDLPKGAAPIAPVGVLRALRAQCDFKIAVRPPRRARLELVPSGSDLVCAGSPGLW
jgi:hypothetical protein